MPLEIVLETPDGGKIKSTLLESKSNEKKKLVDELGTTDTSGYHMYDIKDIKMYKLEYAHFKHSTERSQRVESKTEIILAQSLPFDKNDVLKKRTIVIDEISKHLISTLKETAEHEKINSNNTDTTILQPQFKEINETLTHFSQEAKEMKTTQFKYSSHKTSRRAIEQQRKQLIVESNKRTNRCAIQPHNITKQMLSRTETERLNFAIHNAEFNKDNLNSELTALELDIKHHLHDQRYKTTKPNTPVNSENMPTSKTTINHILNQQKYDHDLDSSSSEDEYKAKIVVKHRRGGHINGSDGIDFSKKSCKSSTHSKLNSIVAASSSHQPMLTSEKLQNALNKLDKRLTEDLQKKIRAKANLTIIKGSVGGILKLKTRLPTFRTVSRSPGGRETVIRKGETTAGSDSEYHSGNEKGHIKFGFDKSIGSIGSVKETDSVATGHSTLRRKSSHNTIMSGLTNNSTSGKPIQLVINETMQTLKDRKQSFQQALLSIPTDESRHKIELYQQNKINQAQEEDNKQFKKFVYGISESYDTVEKDSMDRGLLPEASRGSESSLKSGLHSLHSTTTQITSRITTPEQPKPSSRRPSQAQSHFKHPARRQSVNPAENTSRKASVILSPQVSVPALTASPPHLSHLLRKSFAVSLNSTSSEQKNGSQLSGKLPSQSIEESAPSVLDSESQAANEVTGIVHPVIPQSQPLLPTSSSRPSSHRKIRTVSEQISEITPIKHEKSVISTNTGEKFRHSKEGEQQELMQDDNDETEMLSTTSSFLNFEVGLSESESQSHSRFNSPDRYNLMNTTSPHRLSDAMQTKINEQQSADKIQLEALHMSPLPQYVQSTHDQHINSARETRNTNINNHSNKTHSEEQLLQNITQLNNMCNQLNTIIYNDDEIQFDSEAIDVIESNIMVNRFRRFQMVDNLLNESTLEGRQKMKKDARIAAGEKDTDSSDNEGDAKRLNTANALVNSARKNRTRTPRTAKRENKIDTKSIASVGIELKTSAAEYDGIDSYQEANVFSTVNTQYFVSPIGTVSSKQVPRLSTDVIESTPYRSREMKSIAEKTKLKSDRVVTKGADGNEIFTTLIDKKTTTNTIDTGTAEQSQPIGVIVEDPSHKNTLVSTKRFRMAIERDLKILQKLSDQLAERSLQTATSLINTWKTTNQHEERLQLEAKQELLNHEFYLPDKLKHRRAQFALLDPETNPGCKQSHPTVYIQKHNTLTNSNIVKHEISMDRDTHKKYTPRPPLVPKTGNDNKDSFFLTAMRDVHSTPKMPTGGATSNINNRSNSSTVHNSGVIVNTLPLQTQVANQTTSTNHPYTISTNCTHSAPTATGVSDLGNAVLGYSDIINTESYDRYVRLMVKDNEKRAASRDHSTILSKKWFLVLMMKIRKYKKRTINAVIPVGLLKFISALKQLIILHVPLTKQSFWTIVEGTLSREEHSQNLVYTALQSVCDAIHISPMEVHTYLKENKIPFAPKLMLNVKKIQRLEKLKKKIRTQIAIMRVWVPGQPFPSSKSKITRPKTPVDSARKFFPSLNVENEGEGTKMENINTQNDDVSLSHNGRILSPHMEVRKSNLKMKFQTILKKSITMTQDGQTIINEQQVRKDGDNDSITSKRSIQVKKQLEKAMEVVNNTGSPKSKDKKVLPPLQDSPNTAHHNDSNDEHLDDQNSDMELSYDELSMDEGDYGDDNADDDEGGDENDDEEEASDEEEDENDEGAVDESHENNSLDTFDEISFFT